MPTCISLSFNPDFKDLGVLKPLPVCEFEMGGSEGIVESVQIGKEGKASETEAVDCKWYIRAPPRSKVSPVPFSDLGFNLRK
uniref:Neuropilin and tolloid-like protein 1 n=1 Tax=Sphaerodactylus townsendi TaxID=933632 RepID=A0ACB8FD65_9SAUR